MYSRAYRGYNFLCCLYRLFRENSSEKIKIRSNDLRLHFALKISTGLFGNLRTHIFIPTVISKCLRIRAVDSPGFCPFFNLNKFCQIGTNLWSEPEFRNKMTRRLERYLSEKSFFLSEFINVWRKDIFSPLMKTRSHTH